MKRPIVPHRALLILLAVCAVPACAAGESHPAAPAAAPSPPAAAPAPAPVAAAPAPTNAPPPAAAPAAPRKQRARSHTMVDMFFAMLDSLELKPEQTASI